MNTRIVAALLIAGAALSGAPAGAEKVASAKASHQVGTIRLDTIDLGPRFLDFYAAAKDLPPEERFREWKSRYDFAAVAPTPEGDAMARAMLDEAWPRYQRALPVIRAGAAAMRPRPADAAAKIAALFGVTEPLHIEVLTYVGAFEMNAFTMPGAVPRVAVPLEMRREVRTLILPHEMSHAIHSKLAKLSEGWERSLGRTVFEEGLAIHAARKVAPGRPDRAYLEHKPGWFRAATAKRREILAGLRPKLDARDAQSVLQFTMGKGSQGLEREAYYAGRLVVGRLLEKGMTFPELARVREDDMPRLVEATIAELLN